MSVEVATSEEKNYMDTRARFINRQLPIESTNVCMYPNLISRSISEDKNDQRHAQIRLNPSSRSVQRNSKMQSLVITINWRLRWLWESKKLFKVRLYTFWHGPCAKWLLQKESVDGFIFFTKVHLWVDIWVFFCIFTEKNLRFWHRENEFPSPKIAPTVQGW